MPATKIMLIRHAEKPDGEPGIMPDGSQNPEALTATGWSRARSLVGLFAPADGSFADSRLARPGALFASGSDSLRPKQTLTPLAEALNLVIDASFLKGQEDRLVAAAKNAEGVVLIAWQHEAIPRIATLILPIAFRRDGLGIASMSCGYSTDRTAAPGASSKPRNSYCRANSSQPIAPDD